MTGWRHAGNQDFTFTALTGQDVLSNGDSNLNCGDSFTMGFSATASITVTDNDHSLSGDAWRNEQGDDRRGQTAVIEVNGQAVHTGAKIYAEQVYVLVDQNGRWHFMAEIEVAGEANTDLDDFYAFLGDAPPAGAVLTVAGQFNVRGNWLKYRDLSAGLIWDLDDAGQVVIEAEDMALFNYRIDDIDAASGGEVIKLKRGEGEASLTFGAESGVYALDVAYVDENDGQGSIEVLVNGAVVETITLDQDDNGNGGDASTISSVTIAGLALNQGDAIVLRGARDGAEFARIDAVTFTVASGAAPVATGETVSISQSEALSLDLLQNDTDADDDALTVTEANGAAAGEVFTVTTDGGRSVQATVSSAGVLTFVSAATVFSDLAFGQADSLAIDYTVTDAAGESDTATAAITILGENDGPVLTGAVEASGVEDGADFAVDLLAGASDVDDGAVLSVENLVHTDGDALGAVINGAVINIDASAYNSLSAGQTEAIVFTYNVADEFGAVAAQTATITITGENDAPVISAAVEAAATENDAPFSVNLLDGANDPDGRDALAIVNLTLLSGDDSGVALNGTQLDIDPDTYDSLAADELEVIAFSYDVIDGNGGVAQQTATITIDGLSDAPVAQDIAISGDEDTQIFGQAIAIDPDVNDTLTFTLQTQANIGIAQFSADGSFFWAPGNNGRDFSGEAFFNYQVQDSSGATDIATVTVTVNPVNDAPEATDDSFIIFEGDLPPLDVLNNDSDDDPGDSLTVAAVNGGDPAAGLTVTSANGREASVALATDGSQTLLLDQQGNFDDLAAGETDTITLSYDVSDGNGGVDTADATITVRGVGPATVSASASALTPNTGDAVEITLSGDSSTQDGAADLDVLISGGTVIAADLFLFDDSDVFGALIDNIEFDLPGGTDDPSNPDLISTPLGLELALADVSGFANDLGDGNRAALVVQFDDNGDGVADLPLFAEISIFGLA